MKVLMLSSDNKIFEKGRVFERMVAYSGLVDSLTVIVYTKPGFSEITQGNLRVIPTNSKLKMFYFWDITQKAKTVPSADLVTSQDPMFLGLVARHLSKVFKAKLEVQVHTDIFSSHFSAATHGLARMVLKSADAIRVVSRRIQSSLSEPLRQKSYVLPIAADLEKFLNAPSSDYLKTEFGADTFVFLVVARLEPEKRIGQIIDEFITLQNTYDRMGLAIIGDGGLRGQLEEKAKGNASIKFFGWQEDLVKFYTSASCYVSNSEFEGFGVSMLEAAAVGLPIITTDTGLAGEVIVGNSSGQVIPVNKADALRLAMEWEILNQKTAALFAEVAKSHVAAMSTDSYLKALKSHWEAM